MGLDCLGFSLYPLSCFLYSLFNVNRFATFFQYLVLMEYLQFLLIGQSYSSYSSYHWTNKISKLWFLTVFWVEFFTSIFFNTFQYSCGIMKTASLRCHIRKYIQQKFWNTFSINCFRTFNVFLKNSISSNSENIRYLLKYLSIGVCPSERFLAPPPHIDKYWIKVEN